MTVTLKIGHNIVKWHCIIEVQYMFKTKHFTEYLKFFDYSHCGGFKLHPPNL